MIRVVPNSYLIIGGVDSAELTKRVNWWLEHNPGGVLIGAAHTQQENNMRFQTVACMQRVTNMEREGK